MSAEWKNQVAKRFDGAAEQYDSHSDVQAMAAARLAALLPALERPHILEIGCGTGSLTQELVKKYPDGVFKITDISPRMVAQALENTGDHEGVSWAIMDGENPSCEGKFDLIISNMSFQWFAHPEESLENLRLYLKPGGHIYYSVPGPQSFKEWQSALADLELPSGILNFTAWPGVFEEEEAIVIHDSALDFLRSVKSIGAGTPRQGHKPLGYADMKRVCRQFDQQFNGQVSWQILYGLLA